MDARIYGYRETTRSRATALGLTSSLLLWIASVIVLMIREAQGRGASLGDGMVTNFCRSTHICARGGKVHNIGCNFSNIDDGHVPDSDSCRSCDFQSFRLPEYPWGWSERLATHVGSIHPCTPASGRHGILKALK